MGRGGENNDVGSERVSKFYSHVAESTEADHSDFLAFANAPMPHGRICRDHGAEQRRGCLQLEIRGNPENKMFIDHDALGVTAVGPASEVLVRRVEGEDHVWAVLFKASFALRTGTIRVDHTADRDDVAGFVLCNCRADLRHAAHVLMTGHDRVHSGHELAPLVPVRMYNGVSVSAE